MAKRDALTLVPITSVSTGADGWPVPVRPFSGRIITNIAKAWWMVGGEPIAADVTCLRLYDEHPTNCRPGEQHTVWTYGSAVDPSTGGCRIPPYRGEMLLDCPTSRYEILDIERADYYPRRPDYTLRWEDGTALQVALLDRRHPLLVVDGVAPLRALGVLAPIIYDAATRGRIRARVTDPNAASGWRAAVRRLVGS